ncbi:MAG: helix-turn-helix transcriptional regulator [Chloroflexi bacterium]|nr:helix-turn-helix transcriptional regulator [Chloroflexota bacterium]OJV92330.1 MAG: hypothetical protein BGO39_30810 [Chloroflexi bacterium 54-19]
MSRKKKNLASTALLDSAEAIAKIHQLKIIDPALLGERLRRLRGERKISQRDLTEGLFTSAYLSSVELGKTRPTLETLEKLAERLGEPVDYFLRPTGYSGSKLSATDPEYNTEQLRRLDLRQRLVRAETALLENQLDLAGQEFAAIGNMTHLTQAEQVYFQLLEAALRNQRGKSEEALALLARLTTNTDLGPVFAADNDLAVWLELETGRAYKIQSHYFTALEHFQKGLSVAAGTGFRRRELLLEMGETYQLVEEPQKAADFLQQGLDLFNPACDRETAQALYKNAQELARQGDFQQAAFTLGLGYGLARQTRENTLRLDYTLKAGQLNYSLKKFEQAGDLARTAESLSRLGEDRPEEAFNRARFASLVLLAKSYFQEHNTTLAQLYLDQAARFLENQPALEPLDKAAYFEVAALTFNQPGQAQPEKAAGYYEQAIALLEPLMREDEKVQGKVKPQLAEIYYNYSQLLKDLGRVDQTLENLEKAYRLRSL